MRLVHLADLPEVPWRNGGGITREIAAWRDPAVHPDFLWRVSMATVNAAGPFSRFEDIDRSIAVLDGDGLVLRVGEAEHVLTPSTAPFAFPGEAAVTADVLGASTMDLNAMARRGHFTHSMRRLVVEGTLAFTAGADATILVLLGDVTVAASGETYVAERFGSLVDINAGMQLRLTAPTKRTEAIAVEIHRVA